MLRGISLSINKKLSGKRVEQYYTLKCLWDDKM